VKNDKDSYNKADHFSAMALLYKINEFKLKPVSGN